MITEESGIHKGINYKVYAKYSREWNGFSVSYSFASPEDEDGISKKFNESLEKNRAAIYF